MKIDSDIIKFHNLGFESEERETLSPYYPDAVSFVAIILIIRMLRLSLDYFPYSVIFIARILTDFFSFLTGKLQSDLDIYLEFP